ncbi:MAG: ChbG/HpnK family deacetylase [Thermoleophilia bacterium]
MKLVAPDPHRISFERRAPTGLLIINADDWGGFPAATDSIERCFEIGAITSATAMVYMSDSDRAAQIAIESDRPIGLHLNLTQPFEVVPASPAVRDRQLAACRYFRDLRRRRWTYDPRREVNRLIHDAILDQFDAFERLYGIPPTHMDSHHHAHVCPNVFRSRAIPPGMRVRQIISAPPGAIARPGFAIRIARHAALRRRYITTERFWSGPSLIPALGGSHLGEAIAEAQHHTVEVMVHPSFEKEQRTLLDDDWCETIANARLGDYTDLRPRPAGRGAIVAGALALTVGDAANLLVAVA